MPKPTSRGFTLAEKRSLRFEQVALYMVFLVSIIAAVASFFALTWCGRQFMGPVAPLLPLAVDGFAIACSVGIVRSQTDGEPARGRINEWVGLWIGLGLSIAGNVVHATHTGTGELPDWLLGAFAACIPVIVAYGIHVYCRAISRGVSARVLADAPDEIQLTLPGAPITVSRATEPAHRAPQPRTPRPAHQAVDAARAQDAPAAARSKPRSEKSQAREALFAEFRARQIAGDPMDAPEIAARLGVHPGNARNRRKDWEMRVAAELEAAAPSADPIVDQAARDTEARDASSAA